MREVHPVTHGGRSGNCFKWTDNPVSDAVTYYTIYEDSRDRPFIEDIPYGDPTACRDVTRENAKEYFITASNAEGESGDSVKVVIPPTPTAPNTVNGFGKVTITIEFE